MVICIVARVILGGGVGVGVGAPVAAKMSASCLIASMVWATKRVKGAAGVGFVRASDRRMAASVDASVEYIAGMAMLWVKKCTFLANCLPKKVQLFDKKRETSCMNIFEQEPVKRYGLH